MGERTINQSGSLMFAPGDVPVTCSFEIGDWLSTVSAGNTSQSATHSVIETNVTEETFEATHRVALASGTVLVNQLEQFGQSSMRRQFQVTPKDTVDFGDFVVRFVYEGSDVDSVKIAGRDFEHQGKNRYLQFKTNSADIIGPSINIRMTLEQAHLPQYVQPVVYARDDPSGKWIVHFRALATGGEGFLRLYPGPVDRLASLDRIMRVGSLGKALQYIREQAPIPGRWIPLQYVRTTELAAGDEIRMDVTVEFNPKL